MNAVLSTICQDKFLELMSEFNPSLLYPVGTLAEALRACGLVLEVDDSSESLVIGKAKITLSEVQWGDEGISPIHVLWAVIDAHGFNFTTGMTGTGFRYRSLLGQLAAAWGIRRSYL